MIKNKKNIAILVPKLSSGGTERVASNISINLSNKYNQYLVLYFNDRIDFQYNAELIDLNLKSKNNPFSKINNFYKRIVEMRKIKRKYNIQTTFSLFESPNIVNIFSKQKDRVIISVHFYKSQEVKNIYGRIYDILIRIFYNRADYIITVSEMMRQDLIINYKLKPEKVKTIYNFYNIDTIVKLSKEDIEPEFREIFKYPVIINVSRLVFQKGQWHLIKAFKLIKQEIKDAKLVFIGQDDLKKDYIKLAKSLNLEKDIHFIGFQKNPYKFVKRSSMFALPSLWEGFPNVLVEALVCSTAIVSTDCKSGPRELFSPKSDIFFETEDIEYAEYGVLTPIFDNNYCLDPKIISRSEELFSKAIVKILKNKELRKKYENIALKRAKDFDVKKMIKEYENIF